MELLSMSNKLTDMCQSSVHLSISNKNKSAYCALHTHFDVILGMNIILWIQPKCLVSRYSEQVRGCLSSQQSMNADLGHMGHIFFLRLIFSIQIIKCMRSRLCPRMDGAGRLLSVSWISVMTSQISDINCTTFSLFVT